MKRITISDEAHEYLKGMIEDELISNGDMSEEKDESGNTMAYKPTFAYVVDSLIVDREERA
jgi:hypothetical protein